MRTDEVGSDVLSPSRALAPARRPRLRSYPGAGGLRGAMTSVSVITTFYDEQPQVLCRAIRSIQRQTLRDFEYLVVPGNPENVAALDALKELATHDARIRVVEPGRREGMTACLNLAIRAAKGRFIALHEADDESLPTRLEEQLAFMMTHPDVNVCGAAIRYVEERTQRQLVVRRYPFAPSSEFRKYAAIAHPTIFATRDTFLKFGFYSEDAAVKHSPDYELWLRWLSQGVTFRNLDRVVFNYHQSESNGRNKNVKPTLRSVIRLKEIYRTKMPFTWGDRLFLLGERLLLLVPSRAVSAAFYHWTRLHNLVLRTRRASS
jgi:glycosyltransferase EpsE